MFESIRKSCLQLNDRSFRYIAFEEFKRLLKLKAYWFSFYLLGVVSSLSATFGTDRIASLLERTSFIMTVSTISALGCAIIAGIYHAATGRSALLHMDVIPKVGLIWLLLATIPIHLSLLKLTVQPFDFGELSNASIQGLIIFSIISITFVVSHFGLNALRVRRLDSVSNHAAAQSGLENQAEVPLHAEVPLYIESKDHYVRIVSAQGVEVERARLSDLVEKYGENGLRCHRSYWVSFTAIKLRHRRGRQLLLLLHDGTQIPVGRSFEKDVRASLIPVRRKLVADAVT